MIMHDYDNIFALYPYHDLVIESANGCLITDTKGGEYIDLAAGQLCVLLGHGHPRIADIVSKQARGVVNLGNRFISQAMIDASREISSICQEGLDKVILCSTGGEANEMAIRIARAATGHHEIIGIRKGYYGATNQLLSLSDFVGFIKGIGVRNAGVHKIHCPECVRCPFGLSAQTCQVECVSESAKMLEADSTGEIAALLVEPILGSGGIIIPPKKFFLAVRQLCDRYGALLIADEAQTGVGRTGRWMGMEHHGVRPDICIMAKGLGAGFPVAAVITTSEIESRCIDAPLANISSHSFDPFGAAVATEVIRTIREENLIEKAKIMGQYFRERLHEISFEYGFIQNIRGLGLMIGIDVVSPENGEMDGFGSLVLEAECVKQGLVIGYSSLNGTLCILPPLTITEKEIDRAIVIIKKAARYYIENEFDISRYALSHNSSMKLMSNFIQKLGRQ